MEKLRTKEIDILPILLYVPTVVIIYSDVTRYFVGPVTDPVSFVVFTIAKAFLARTPIVRT